jgi:hypothetical protein
MGDESWLRYFCPHCKVCAQSRAEVIERTRQPIGAKHAMITVFFTAQKLIVFDVLPKDSKFNYRYFINYGLPGLTNAFLNFRGRMSQLIFWMHMNSSLCRK